VSERLVHYDTTCILSKAGFCLTTILNAKLEDNPNLTYSEALTEVQKENPKLAKEYFEDLKGKRQGG
jgi:outer membrane protein assembly factor BamD (BamD/ComL family)